MPDMASPCDRPPILGRLARVANLANAACAKASWALRGSMQTSSFGPVGTLRQTVRRDFSDVSYDEAMRRAREVVPALRERAQATEDARGLLRENEQLLHETGL